MSPELEVDAGFCGVEGMGGGHPRIMYALFHHFMTPPPVSVYFGQLGRFRSSKHAECSLLDNGHSSKFNDAEFNNLITKKN